MAESSATLVPVSVKTKRSCSRRPLGCNRGASSAAASGSALIAAATPCAVQRSRKVSRRAIPGSGENVKDVRSQGRSCPSLAVRTRSKYRFSRRPAGGYRSKWRSRARSFFFVAGAAPRTARTSRSRHAAGRENKVSRVEIVGLPPSASARAESSSRSRVCCKDASASGESDRALPAGDERGWKEDLPQEA